MTCLKFTDKNANQQKSKQKKAIVSFFQNCLLEDNGIVHPRMRKRYSLS